MRFPNPLAGRRHRRAGVALVIILAFVVILTGVIVAFFSRSIWSRQLSNASASQTKVDMLASNAAEKIIADLQQEIVMSSSATPTNVAGTPGLPTSASTIYFPLTPTSMLPQISGTTASAAGLPPNLLKRSAYDYGNNNPIPFYVGTNGSSGSSGSIPGVTVGVSSTTASVNGRIIPAARWNSHYLLPLSGTATDSTPILTGSTAFTPPDWILISRNGANPVQTSLTTPQDLTWSGTAQTTVVGRYAYAIYHEGGLLDANVAGYPVGPGSAAVIPNTVYKPALSYADLTQLPGGLTQTQVDQLIAWRNYASTQAPGSPQSPGFAQASGSSYYNFVQFNPTGFLAISSTALNNNGSISQTAGQSDRMFSNRQELIAFMQKNLGLSGTSLNVLNYLATFTRDLNQPSLVKTQSVNAALPGYDASAPSIQTIANGGNNQAGLDAYVNPAFSTVRVKNSFTRNDGSVAVQGEPLVKKRFALNRLAWLTYEGPSAGRTQSDPDIQLLINNYQIPYSFLQQGTAQNIKTYFGLTWVPDPGSSLGRWVYNVHNGPSGSGTAGPIMRLGAPGDNAGIASLSTPHEPDFFELLKAAISAGSKAKVATIVSGTTAVSDYQAQNDVSFDYAAIQVGANIIAQAKVDGFGVRISFNDGALGTKEFDGVENNPYLYRVRWGVLKIRNENPVFQGLYPLPDTTGTVAAGSSGKYQWQASQGLLKDPGVSLLMLIPEIWNPHDQSAPMPAASLRPSVFRIVADSVAPDHINPTDVSGYDQITATGVDTRDNGNNNPESYNHARPSGGSIPPFSRASGGTGTEITGGYLGYLHPLQPSNTAIVFNIPTPLSGSLFREPTLLARYSVPAGSNLHIDSSNWSGTAGPDADYATVQTSNGVSFTSNQGFTSDSANPLVLPNTGSVSTTTEYVGIPVGLFPCEWIVGRFPNETPVTLPGNIDRSDLAAVSGSLSVTYRLQYQDPTNASNWITYDTKYAKPATAWLHNVLGSSGAGGMMQAIGVSASFTDPRTSRFGAITPSTSGTYSSNAVQYSPPGAAKYVKDVPATYGYGISETQPANPSEWIDPANDVLITNRPTVNGGYYVNQVPNQAPGWYSTGMMQGLLSQNSTADVNDGKKYSGSFGTDPSTGTVGGANYYLDPDNVARRAMGAYVTGASSTVGLPMASTLNPGPSAGPSNQSQSRPWILHRPFRSVAELGYVFSGTPWKNLDFFTPESGDAGLLDVFCINDVGNSNGLVAGKVNLNTAQAPVLKAILAGAYRDEQTSASTTLDASIGGVADQIASALVRRTLSTSGTTGRLTNVSDMVGKWAPGSSSAAPIDGSVTYNGLGNDLSGIFNSVYGANSSMTNIQRFREAAIRPLAAAGSTRVWNVMIDLVAQAGRYPQRTTNFANFVVDGEQRYWVHISIDRLTGEVLDKQVEVVKE
jgi:hypothetical protein